MRMDRTTAPAGSRFPGGPSGPLPAMALGLIGALVLVIVAVLASGGWVGSALALAPLAIGGLGLARYVQRVTNGRNRDLSAAMQSYLHRMLLPRIPPVASLNSVWQEAGISALALKSGMKAPRERGRLCVGALQYG